MFHETWILCLFYSTILCFKRQTNKKIHKVISRRGDLTSRRHLAKENINGCRRRWATERSLGNWVRGCQEVILFSVFQDLIHLVPHFLCFGLSPLSFYICCLASPESESHWRSSAYSRLATTLLLLERTRANIRCRSVSVVSSFTHISKLSLLSSWLMPPKLLSISQH